MSSPMWCPTGLPFEWPPPPLTNAGSAKPRCGTCEDSTPIALMVAARANTELHVLPTSEDLKTLWIHFNFIWKCTHLTIVKVLYVCGSYFMSDCFLNEFQCNTGGRTEFNAIKPPKRENPFPVGQQRLIWQQCQLCTSGHGHFPHSTSQLCSASLQLYWEFEGATESNWTDRKPPTLLLAHRDTSCSFNHL